MAALGVATPGCVDCEWEVEVLRLPAGTHHNRCYVPVADTVSDPDSIPKVDRDTRAPQDTKAFPKAGEVQVIEFTTVNSDYVFTWVTGQRDGALLCRRGTFVGEVIKVEAEYIRDLAWPGERIFSPQITTTTITSVKR